jgi:hypothetical protein
MISGNIADLLIGITLVFKPKKLCISRPENLKMRKVMEDKMPGFFTFVVKEIWAFSVLRI